MAQTTNDATNVGVGKPKVGGAVFIAPVGTKLPTDASSPLDPAFKCIGYISEDGITFTEERDSAEIAAWGGDTVSSTQTSYKENVSFTPIETNPEVAKMEYGDDNVEVEAGKMHIKHTAAPLPEKALVCETVPNEKTVTRYVAPRAKLTEKGDLALNDSDPLARECTFAALPGADGVTVHEYHAITGLTAE